MQTAFGSGGGAASRTASGSSPSRIPAHRLALLLAGGMALVLGMYTGLARGGVQHRFVGADLHAVLMVLGFLGTLIALERAVALGRPWGYLAPAFSAAAVVALPVSRSAGGALLVLAGVVTTGTYLSLLRRHIDTHLVVMLAGSLAWVAAAALWLTGSSPVRITPLLAAFLVLTIVGERLELSRMTLPGPRSVRRLLAAIVVFAVGAAIAQVWRSTGLVVAGGALLGQVVWLVRHDIARRTIRRPGLPRFAAACMLAGYLWLGVSGVLWVAMGAGVTGLLLHDALVHSLFLGFVLSMVMGHAPIIVPAVLRRPLRFTPVAYLPLALLHLSVAVRVGADLAGSLWWREIALHGNVTALVLFVVVTIRTVRKSADTGDGASSTVNHVREHVTEVDHGRVDTVDARRSRRRHVGPAEADPFLGVRRLAIATAAGTLLLIAMGGAVRATDSGLACPDWPACYGQWIPPADVNMWFEHSHRLWAGIIGLAITLLTVWTFARFRDRPALWRLSLTALVLVMAQAGLGAAVVLLHLRAGLVTSHLGMSLVVVGCLIALAVLARPPSSGPRAPGARWVGRWAAAVGGLVLLQALLGGQATGRGAAQVFNAVPIWLTEDAWTGHAREWLHVAHRAGGYLVAAAVMVFVVAVRRRGRTDPTLPSWAGPLAWLALGLVVAQVTLGITNVLTRASVVSAIGHLTVASWLWATFVLMAARGLLAPARDVLPAGAATAAPAATTIPVPSGITDPGRPHGPDHDRPSTTTQEVNA